MASRNLGTNVVTSAMQMQLQGHSRTPACLRACGRFWFLSLSLVLYVFGRTTGSGNLQLQYNAFVKRSSRVRERVRGRGEVKLLNPGIKFVS